jgi:hypothetical protein
MPTNAKNVRPSSDLGGSVARAEQGDPSEGRLFRIVQDHISLTVSRNDLRQRTHRVCENVDDIKCRNLDKGPLAKTALANCGTVSIG